MRDDDGPAKNENAISKCDKMQCEYQINSVLLFQDIAIAINYIMHFLNQISLEPILVVYKCRYMM